MVVGTTTRLRASCNACNESKVRCSQDKPTCARCERNETECIYGLSRRTHKDAPPISVNPSNRRRKQSRPGGDIRLTPGAGAATAPSTNSNSPSTTTTGSSGCTIPEETVDMHNNNASLFPDYMFPTSTGADTMHDPAQMLDFSGLVPGSTSSTAMTPGYFSTTGTEYANPTTRDLESLFGTNQNADAMDMGAYRTPSSDRDCSCHAGVMELLTTMRCGNNNCMGSGRSEQRQSIDTQLAKLRQCIISSETSMRCTHARKDSEPIHIMAVAMLIGYAIDEFKVLASEASIRRPSPLSSSASISSLSSSSSAAAVAAENAILGNSELRNKYRTTTPGNTGISPGTFMEPRLQWGVLELEEDDEMDLRHRLYLLSFRKLERLLSQLPAYIQDMHSSIVSLPDPSRHMAFVIVCDYTRLWLEKKAGDVRRLFSMSTSNEMKNSRYI